MTTPQRIWLIQCWKVNVLHLRHSLRNNSVPSSVKQQREITTYTAAVLKTTWVWNSNLLRLYQFQRLSPCGVDEGYFSKIAEFKQGEMIITVFLAVVIAKAPYYSGYSYVCYVATSLSISTALSLRCRWGVLLQNCRIQTRWDDHNIVFLAVVIAKAPYYSGTAVSSCGTCFYRQENHVSRKALTFDKQ